MRRCILLLNVLCLLLSSCFMGSTLLYLDSDSANKPNLLKNPDFEKAARDNSKLPDGWFIISSTEGETLPVSFDSLVVMSGRKSLRIKNNSKNLYLVSESFKINYTGGYYARCWFRSDTRTQKPIRLYFWAYNAAGDKKNSFRRSLKVKNVWKRASISAGFLKNSVSFARIAIFIPKGTDNTIWLDDAGCFYVHQFMRE
jgi:hypothetical protein